MECGKNMNKEKIIQALLKRRVKMIDMVCEINDNLNELGYTETKICTSHCKCYKEGVCKNG